MADDMGSVSKQTPDVAGETEGDIEAVAVFMNYICTARQDALGNVTVPLNAKIIGRVDLDLFETRAFVDRFNLLARAIKATTP